MIYHQWFRLKSLSTFHITIGLPTPTGLCQAGFYCTLQASSRAPTDYITRNVCPAGAYCDEGTVEMRGNTRPEDCLSCEEGKFCDGWGLKYPLGKCSAGF